MEPGYEYAGAVDSWLNTRSFLAFRYRIRMSSHRMVRAALALLLLASLSFAQATLGIVKGRILDETGALVPGANVTVTGDRFTRTAVSGNDGTFTLVGIPTGV